MRETGREAKARELDEAALAFRVARRGSGEVKGWLRTVRQAVGVPVGEVARRLGVSKWEVYRLEQAEMGARIRMETLQKAAAALGCDLVYGLAPRAGTLTELTAEQTGIREAARAAARQKTAEKRAWDRKAWLDLIGWRRAILWALGTELRRNGIRVRPRKTEKNVDAGLEGVAIVRKLQRIPMTRREVEAAQEITRREREAEARERRREG
jgi:transcriptional regulator with XRE-family HTH domain